MRKAYLPTIAAIVLGVLSVSTARAEIIIDSFDVTTQSVSVSGPPSGFKSDFSSVAAVEAIGGERDLYVERVSSNSGSVGADVGFSITGAANYESGSATRGSAIVSWDAVDGSATLNTTGLGGVDLTQGGANTGLGTSAASDLGAPLIFTIYTDATHFSQYTLTLPGDPSFTFVTYFIPFASFIPMGTMGGADFTNVGAVVMKIDGSTTPSTDVSVDFVRVTGIIPEPASLTLFGLGAAGLIGWRWRRGPVKE